MEIKPSSGNTIRESDRSPAVFEPSMINHNILMIESRLAALESDIERINNVLNTAFDRIDALDVDVRRLQDSLEDQRKHDTALGARVMQYFLESSKPSMRSSEIRKIFGIASSAQTIYVMRSAVNRSHGMISMTQVQSRTGKENILIKNAKTQRRSRTQMSNRCYPKPNRGVRLPQNVFTGKTKNLRKNTQSADIKRVFEINLLSRDGKTVVRRV